MRGCPFEVCVESSWLPNDERKQDDDNGPVIPDES